MKDYTNIFTTRERDIDREIAVERLVRYSPEIVDGIALSTLGNRLSVTYRVFHLFKNGVLSYERVRKALIQQKQRSYNVGLSVDHLQFGDLYASAEEIAAWCYQHKVKIGLFFPDTCANFETQVRQGIKLLRELSRYPNVLMDEFGIGLQGVQRKVPNKYLEYLRRYVRVSLRQMGLKPLTDLQIRPITSHARRAYKKNSAPQKLLDCIVRKVK